MNRNDTKNPDAHLEERIKNRIITNSKHAESQVIGKSKNVQLDKRDDNKEDSLSD